MLKILIFILCTTLASTTCGPEQTMRNQGRNLCCHNDARGIPTIGIGFQLKRNDAATAMAAYNLTVSNILKDCERNTTRYCLTNGQAEDLFYRILYREAAACVDKYVPDLPTMTRAAVIDLAFAGCETLNKFVRMKKALAVHDWKQAAEELRTSVWCAQVKQRRCGLAYNCILNKSYSDQLYSSTTSDCLYKRQCYYYKTSNGKSFSTSGIQCSRFPNCTYCSSSTSVCIMYPCCTEPICVPLSLNGTCASNSTGSLSLLDLQTNFNRLTEIINRRLTLDIVLLPLLFVVTLFLSLTVFCLILRHSKT